MCQFGAAKCENCGIQIGGVHIYTVADTATDTDIDTDIDADIDADLDTYLY